MQHPTPPLPPERDPHNPQYRTVLRWFTALLVLGLLTAALWPSGGFRPQVGKTPPSTPPVAERPPASDPAVPVTAPPTPVRPPDPALKPPADPAPKPLPGVPEGEPSRLVAHGDRSCAMIALTYDAGSGADGAAQIIETLARHGVKSTFFLTGRWVEKYPELARRIAADGHEIANHTYSHPDLTKLSAAEVIEEVTKGEEAIRKVTGKESRPLFREPYGAFNDVERRLVRQAGFSYSIYWDVDTLDWQFPSVETLVQRITGKSQNGSIVLMHLNVPDTAVASDQAIPILRQKNYRLVTVSELLSCKP